MTKAINRRRTDNVMTKAINRRRTDNVMTKATNRRRTDNEEGQTMKKDRQWRKTDNEERQTMKKDRQWRRTDNEEGHNVMAKEKGQKNITIYKTLHRKPNIEQHGCELMCSGMVSSEAPIMSLLYSWTRFNVWFIFTVFSHILFMLFLFIYVHWYRTWFLYQ